MGVFGSEELPMQSSILRAVSPVFDAMLASQMHEAHTHRIHIQNATYSQFKEFYEIMLPLVGRRIVISNDNIDHLLSLSQYYQVQPLIDECLACLGNVRATVPRLLMAHQFELKSEYKRFVSEIGSSFSEHDLSALKDYPKVLLDIVLEAQKEFDHDTQPLQQVLQFEVQVRNSLSTRPTTSKNAALRNVLGVIASAKAARSPRDSSDDEFSDDESSVLM